MRIRRDIIDPNADPVGTVPPTTPTPSSSLPPSDNGPPRNYNPMDTGRMSSTDTIAAVTVAVLAVLIVISVLLICRAIRKRRRAMRGMEISAIPTISTGVMGTGVSAYGNVSVAGHISWESVEESGNQNREEAVQGAMAMSPTHQYDNSGYLS